MWWGYAALITTLAAGTIITLYTTRGFHGNIGCNDAVRRRCEPGEPSVCRKKTCRGTTVGGKTFKRAMLAIHTELRKRPSANGSYGGDMNLLTWDDQLARGALAWAHYLCIEGKVDHDENKCRVTERYDSVGQNVVVKSGRDYSNETLAAREAAKIWYDEIDKMPPDAMFPFRWTVEAGHYTALVWSRSYKIGCGLVKKPVPRSGYKAYVVCNYSPSGNVRGANYNVFEPSKKLANACRPGTRKGKSGLCEIRNEIEYRKHLGLITVPPPKTHS